MYIYILYIYICTYVYVCIFCVWMYMCCFLCASLLSTCIHVYIEYKENPCIIMITVQSSTIVLLRSTVDYHLIKV